MLKSPEKGSDLTMRWHNQCDLRAKLWLVTGGLLFLSLSLVPLATAAQSLPGHWTSFEQISHPAPYASEPKITADIAGQLHVVWTERDEAGMNAIVYTRWRDGKWTDPLDIMVTPGVNDAWAVDIEADPGGLLHLIWVGQNTLYYSHASIRDAHIAPGWLPPMKLAYGVARSGWAGDMLLDDEGRLHLIYADGFEPRLFYVRSDDSGMTWSEPLLVGAETGNNEGTTEVMLARDGAGRLHAAWTTRRVPGGWPGIRAFYSRSLDNGQTWNEPLLVDTIENPFYLENRGPFFLSLGIRGTDEIHLAWAGAPNGDRWHQWSHNGGQTWLPSRMILGGPGERYGTTGFLAMIEGPTGYLHLFTTFRASDGGLLTSTWQGTDWGQPISLPFGTLNCEDPRVVIALGNQLHLVCVNEKGTGTPDEGVYHTWRLLDAPAMPPVPIPEMAKAITSVTSVMSVSSTFTLSKTRSLTDTIGSLSSAQSGIPAESTSPLAIAILPSVLLIVIVVIRRLVSRPA